MKKSKTQKRRTKRKNRKQCPVDEGESLAGENQDYFMQKKHYLEDGTPCMK